MTTKQFSVLIALLVIISSSFAYDSAASRSARERCATYAMPVTLRSFEDSMIETGEEFPPKRLAPEMSVAAKANYDFFYDFCMDNWEGGRR